MSEQPSPVPAGMTDRMWNRITRMLIDTGRPPHHAELASVLGVSPAESRRILHAVLEAYPIGWLHPETDYIASFPPLNGLPTQYRVIVRGEQKWFAQCGFEATSVTWLFPGERVRIDDPQRQQPRLHVHGWRRPVGAGVEEKPELVAQGLGPRGLVRLGRALGRIPSIAVLDVAVDEDLDLGGAEIARQRLLFARDHTVTVGARGKVAGLDES